VRFYHIMAFVFAFNLALSLYANLGITTCPRPSFSPNIPHPSEINVTRTNMTQESYYANVLNAVTLFFNVFYDMTVGFYPLLIELGVPDVIASVLATIVYFLYAIALVQFFTKSLGGGE